MILFFPLHEFRASYLTGMEVVALEEVLPKPTAWLRSLIVRTTSNSWATWHQHAARFSFLRVRGGRINKTCVCLLLGKEGGGKHFFAILLFFFKGGYHLMHADKKPFHFIWSYLVMVPTTINTTTTLYLCI